MRYIAAAALLVVLISPLYAAERVAIEGTRVSLVPPGKFQKAENFQGFQLKDKNASILIMEITAPYGKFAEAFTKEGLASRGMKLLAKEALPLKSGRGLLLSVSQNAYGTDFRKWIVVTGDNDTTVMITAVFPESFEKELSKTMKASILSFRLSEKKDSQGTEGLPFSIEIQPPLKLARRFGNNLLFSKNGEFPAQNEKDPVFIVGASVSSGLVVDDKKEYSLQRVKKVEQVKDIAVESTAEVTIDGITGYEIVASGIDRKEGFKTLVYQVMLFKETDYFIIQGFSDEEEKGTYLPLFKKIAESFKKKAPSNKSGKGALGDCSRAAL
ncbi:MAG: hypothetical protein RDV48_01320 [Candidatus Eremiobacteraeota bacterium]|nr:hypothetical protein [Candidatus Eremiobacteraeota bacterium]